jgi:hypothetical protein
MRPWFLLLPLLAHCGGRSALDDFASPPVGSVTRDASTPDTFVAPLDAPASTPDAPVAAFDAPFPSIDGSGITSCVPCLAFTCADNYVQCEQGSACFTIYQCLVNGGTDADCICLAPSGADAYLALARCIQAVACAPGECTTLCANSPADRYCATDPVAPSCDGVPVDVGRDGSPSACKGCVASSCATFTAVCGPESDCQDYIACLATCGTNACPNDCAAAHSVGQSDALALDVCLGGTCQTECGF